MDNSPLDLLTPDNCTFAFIDHQPQMIFGVGSSDRQTIINNTVGLAKAAKVFRVPTILTTVEANSFSGPLIAQLQNVFPNQTPIDRSSMNAWEDKNFVAAVEKTNRKKLVIAALWTEICLAFPALSAIKAGYEVYCVVDASGGTSLEAHNTAIQRMIQVGVIPVTWIQVMCELQRDWARQDTYTAVMNIAKEHTGAYGAGIFYAQSIEANHEKI